MRKLIMNFMARRVMAGVVMVGVGLGCAGLGFGQQGLPPGQPARVAAEERPFTVSVNFPGGKVREYVLKLKANAEPHAVNVVVSAAAMEVELAEISLREVQVETALQAIQAAAGHESGSWEIRRMPGGDQAFAVDYSARAVGVHLYPVAGQPGAMMEGQPAPSMSVFSIREITEAMPGDPEGMRLAVKPETVLTAVRVALDIGGIGQNAPEMKYHAESGLVIVRGTQQQTQAVAQTLEKMTADVQSRREAARQNAVPRAELRQMKSSLQKTNLRIAEFRGEVERARDAVKRSEQMADMGGQSDVEVQRAKGMLSNAETQLRILTIEAQQQQDAIKDAGGSLDGDGVPGSGIAVVMYDLSGQPAEVREKVAGMLAAVGSSVGNLGKLQISGENGNKRVVVKAEGALNHAIGVMIREITGGSVDSTVQSEDEPRNPGRQRDEGGHGGVKPEKPAPKGR